MKNIEEILQTKGIYLDKFIVARNNTDFASIVMQSFHTKEVAHIKRNDSYFAHIRANNFCVELGVLDFEVPIEAEDYQKLVGELGTPIEETTFALVTGNHKGLRVTTIWALPTVYSGSLK